MPLEEEKIVSASTASGKIIAAGIVIAFCYWASSILVTLLVAVLLAYFLDPVVNWLEDWHVPRALGSLLVVLFTIAAILVVACCRNPRRSTSVWGSTTRS
jgi:predicted PurR-regulated permease PerM